MKAAKIDHHTAGRGIGARIGPGLLQMIKLLIQLAHHSGKAYTLG